MEQCAGACKQKQVCQLCRHRPTLDANEDRRFAAYSLMAARGMSKDKEGFIERIEEKLEEHREEREAERKNAKNDPNKKEREIDRLNKKTSEFDSDAAWAAADVFNEET